MLPIIRLEGQPHAQGRAHGQALAERVRHNVDAYFRRFYMEGGLDAEAVRALAAPYEALIAAEHPGYAAAMRGLAEAAAVPPLDLVALNVRYEILYHLFASQALAPAALPADGCSAFAALPSLTAEGQLILAQNWDWYPEVEGAVLHTVDRDAAGETFETLAFTEAGIVGGKMGLNSAGLGLAINGLVSAGDDVARLGTPFHVRCHAILRQREHAAALAIVEAGERACSANFLIAQAPDRVADLEAAPERVGRLEAEGGRLAHTNHFYDAAGLGVDEPLTDTRPYSVDRLARCRSLLGGLGPERRLGIPEAMAFLRDHEGHPQSLCRHPDPRRPEGKQSTTVASAIMDLNAGAMWISDGPPCEAPYQALRLDRPPRIPGESARVDGAGRAEELSG